ncbi:MAG TPA: ELM1/GtrOC1 family putative glycosyltransferase [Sphingomicrobium sp.]
MNRRDGPDVWVLLGPHKGDNHQVLALAEALGLPFRTLEMRYRWFAHLPAVLRDVTIAQLEPEIRRQIAPPWPSLVLGIGQRSAPVARYIQQASGRRTKIVRLGDPMVSHRLFDLVITTTQYAVRDGENVVRLPVTITGQQDIRPDREEQAWLDRFARPRRLIVIGGKTSLWRFDADVVIDAARTLQRRADREGGSVIAATSPRTSTALLSAARAALGEDAVVDGQFPRYPALLRAADEIHVTGDSVSMLSDAIATGKPVGLIPLESTVIGELLQRVGQLRGKPFRMRDLNKFWNDLHSRGLVGSVDSPRCGSLEFSPIDTAVTAVRSVINQGQEILVSTPPMLPAAPAAEPLAL